ncbi:MAG: lysophospholipid acyltransferase family protein [Armatimonadetes bacterium]|nr:lysophospholipid acyltransferase family protein [Armatimonadota bacterium]
MAKSNSLALRKRLERKIGGAALRGVAAVVRAMPERFAVSFGRRLGRLIFRGSRKYRERTLANLRMAFPEWSDERVRDTAVAVFEHFARTAVRFFRVDRLTDQQIVDSVKFEGLDYVKSATDKGKGALVITAHFGDWERMAQAFTLLGYKISVVARDANEERTTQMINAVRNRHGIEVFSRGKAAREILRRLAKNEIVGILTDQNTREILVPFFGFPAGTNEAPAALHLRTGSPLITAFCEETGTDEYRVIVEPLDMPVPSGDKDADILAIMTKINERIESAIRRCPEQWLWMHDRWRWARELGIIE